jgi:hypothetical protein
MTVDDEAVFPIYENQIPAMARRFGAHPLHRDVHSQIEDDDIAGASEGAAIRCHAFFFAIAE